MKRTLAALAVVMLLSVPLKASAQTITSPSPSGISLTPALEQINLSKNQGSAAFNVTLSNNNPYAIVVSVSTSDFTALNTSGSVAFLNNGDGSHGLKQLLHPTVNEVPLPPRSSVVVPVSISGVGSLAPGGHYGALIFKVVPLNISVKGNSLSTNEELSVLVFLTTASGGTQAVQLNPPSISSVVTNLPSTINLVITNTGNTQTSPLGQVNITTGSRQLIAKGVINGDSGLVLPSTQRLYAVNLTAVKNTLAPGIYHVNVSYQASSSSKRLTYSKSILLIPTSLVISLAVVVLVIIVVLIRRFGPKNLIYYGASRQPPS
jgi:hypothetical protein